MRHLNTEELLLYAESELDDRTLCRHVQDCVDCKASLVEVQETFVRAASTIRASVPRQQVELQAASLTRLRAGIAAETEKISQHLTSEDLLLSSEAELSADREAHLSVCGKCQRKAADLRILLADIEAELRSLMPDEAVERKAAALVALEQRLAETATEIIEVERQPAKVIEFPVTRVRKYAAFAAAAAAAFVMWGGFQAMQSPELPTLPAVAQFAPAVPASAFSTPPPVETLARLESLSPTNTISPTSVVDRFEFVSSDAIAPPGESFAAFASAPQIAVAAPVGMIRWTAPQPQPYRLTEESTETIVALAEPDPIRQTSPKVVILAQGSNGPLGGMVRNSLLAHYRDAARRSFQSPTSSLLEGELDRYVSDVLRNDSELLSHVHAVNSALSGADASQLARSSELGREIRTHLDGIANREAAIYASLSEVLPRRYWTYRAEVNDAPAGAVDPLIESNELLADALGLDETLTTLFVIKSATVDASGNEHSCGERLARIRSHVARLRQAIN